MKIPADGKLLRIFIGEADKYNGKPLYEEIIFLAKKSKLAGATAIKGLWGLAVKATCTPPIYCGFPKIYRLLLKL